MLMSSLVLLNSNPEPSDDEIRRGISGNLCRCTGYQNIVASVRNASSRMAKVSAAKGGAQ
jgi:carbon-monoxide dehydrogenase small subunit